MGRALSGAIVGAVGALSLITALGCGGDDAPKSGNGVNDVRAACEIRATWNRTGNDCSVCESAVVSPRCDCDALKDFSAACVDQENARKTACADSVDTCVFSCNRTDCSCIDACYVSGEACKAASAARDGCIAETCSGHCK